jgi:hypothetical protein
VSGVWKKPADFFYGKRKTKNEKRQKAAQALALAAPAFVPILTRAA